MNTKKVVSILIGIMLISFGIGFLTLYLSGNKPDTIFSIKHNSWGFTRRKNSGNYKKIDEKRTANINGINKIDIEASIADINIVSEDRENISLYYYGDISTHINTNLETKTIGDKLIIEAKTKNLKSNFNSTNIDLHLDIIIPSTYTDNLNIKSDLGSIHIEDLELNKLYVMGELGNINIKNTYVVELDASSSLGKISIEDVYSKENKLVTDLGSISVKNVTGDLEVKTDLGRIELEYHELSSNINAKSNSGNIEIILPKKSNFTLDANTGLGSIDTNFPLDTMEKSNTKVTGKVGSGANGITLSVDLGSISIKGK
ncbi:MAG: DUF4097 domain-containing protein [Tissierellia bacterium]|nr:DUF4097 domain-containing protein [Tissierellia bacterium]